MGSEEMKIAVLSDIHGNLTALNAVLKDITDAKIDKFIIAGDHIIDCPQHNEVLNRMKSLDAYVIKGNREKYIMDYHYGIKSDWRSYKQMAAPVWVHDSLEEDNLKYISELPEQLSISLPQRDSIRVVHGSPFDISEQLYEEKYPERVEKALKEIEESVLICGHTHWSWSKRVFNKLILNPGSVGVPFNKRSCAEYAVLTWSDNQWSASHHQVEFNIEELEQMFFESGLYQECRAWSRVTLESIKQGKDIAADFINHAYELARKNGFDNSKLIPNHIWDKAEELWFKI